MEIIYALSVGVFFGLGVFQLLRRDLIKAAMGFTILFTSVNLFFLAAGAYNAEVPAYDQLAEQAQVSDPLVQALALTAIVIGFGSYALLLAMVNVVSRRFETIDSDEVDKLTK
jgi:multicomponent Na+:H+ antiporter subunit C